MFNRRQLLKSLAAVAALAGVGHLLLPDDELDKSVYDLTHLRPIDQTILTALIPVLLDGYIQRDNFPAELRQRLLRNLNDAIAWQTPRVQKELSDLFMLLEIKLTRLVMMSSPRNWHQISFEQKDQALMQWRDHFLAITQTAYSGVHDLVLAAYFVEPDGWHHMAYIPPVPVRGS